jgi:hypothetical protein
MKSFKMLLLICGIFFIKSRMLYLSRMEWNGPLFTDAHTHTHTHTHTVYATHFWQTRSTERMPTGLADFFLLSL